MPLGDNARDVPITTHMGRLGEPGYGKIRRELYAADMVVEG